MPTYATLDELKASAEYLAAGIIGRERLIAFHFPGVFDGWRSMSEEHLESVALSKEVVGDGR